MLNKVNLYHIKTMMITRVGPRTQYENVLISASDRKHQENRHGDERAPSLNSKTTSRRTRKAGKNARNGGREKKSAYNGSFSWLMFHEAP